MNKLLWISGLTALSLLCALLLGLARMDDADGAAWQALRQGNALYAQARYTEALELYETGLAARPGDAALNFNAGQAAYQLDEAETAVAYYEGSEDSVEKFLNSGNASFWLASANTDVNEIERYYTRALQSYELGMTVYPQNVPLKYNYEFVRQKMRVFLAEVADQSDSQNPPAAGEGSQEVLAQGKQGRDESGSSEERSSEAEGGDPENSGDDEQKQAGEMEKTEEDDGGGGDQGENQGRNESEGQGQTNREAELENLLRIMRIVEGQEEENLKNNQGVMEEKDTYYGSW